MVEGLCPSLGPNLAVVTLVGKDWTLFAHDHVLGEMKTERTSQGDSACPASGKHGHAPALAREQLCTTGWGDGTPLLPSLLRWAPRAAKWPATAPRDQRRETPFALVQASCKSLILIKHGRASLAYAFGFRAGASAK